MLYALLFPLYRPGHFVIALAASAVVYGIARLFCKDIVEEVPQEPETTGNQELDQMIAQGKGALDEMRRLNDSIQDAAISAQIERLSQVSDKIFQQVQKDPSQLPQIRKFMSYYLPTTLKLLENYADVIMVGFEDCRQHYKHPERIAVTGTPVRGDFFRLSREEARKKLGFDDEAPLVVSFWGSLGASHMNECMVDFFRREDAEGYPFRHIHAVGKGGWEAMEQKLRELGLPKSDRLDVRQYIYDMDVVMAAADVVLCRAGASTISELTALGKPTVMVPSPYVTNNHQEKNARLLEKHGGAVVITEPESTGDGLYKAVEAILSDHEKRISMARAMKELGIPDATARIYDTVMALVRK